MNSTAKPEWIDKNLSQETFADENILRIIVFFLFHAPCEGQSAMGRTIEEYNWSNPWKQPYDFEEKLKHMSSNPNLIFMAENYSEMDKKLEDANLTVNFPSDLATERICVHKYYDRQIKSVFYHLRNSFAHGRFNIVNADGETVLIFEDVRNKTTYEVSARMILKISTLLKWIDIIEAGEKEYKD